MSAYISANLLPSRHTSRTHLPQEAQQCEPTVLVRALRQQQVRAEVRLEALQQIVELLSVETTTCSPTSVVSCHNDDVNPGASASAAVTSVANPVHVLLPSAHLQLLIGCFGLSQLTSDKNDARLTLNHYQVCFY